MTSNLSKEGDLQPEMHFRSTPIKLTNNDSLFEFNFLLKHNKIY